MGVEKRPFTLNSVAHLIPSKRAQQRKLSSRQWSCCASKPYSSASTSRLGRVTWTAGGSASTSLAASLSSPSSFTMSIRLSGTAPSLLKFQCMIILSQRIFGDNSSAMRRMVICLCLITASDFSLNSGSSESSASSSRSAMANFKPEISQMRICFRSFIHVSKRSSLSWIRSRKVNSSTRWYNHNWLRSQRISLSRSKRWFPELGPWMISAAVLKSWASKLYWASRPSIEACHDWSEAILAIMNLAMLQIHSTRFAGSLDPSFLSCSSSSLSSCSS
mmetsp:Transcript_58847/g.126469  ORF Transcript_58847/g.126469 Transcript_58847/m.126469 type:complete len:276 (-) Transcript_58847:578-1405(-)